MKKALQKLAIIWIAALAIVGLNKDKLRKSDEEEKKSPKQEISLDEYELSSFHNN